MAILWKRREATAEEIRKSIRDDLHDSTVRTLLRILETKGFVAHTTRGRRFVYRPIVERSAVEKSAIAMFLKSVFHGSARDLLIRLIEEEHLSVEEIEKIATARPPSQKQKHSRKRGQK